jgi:hypothetical protein
MLVSCLTSSSTVKMEATCSADTSVEFQWPTQRYIPVDRTLQQESAECELAGRGQPWQTLKHRSKTMSNRVESTFSDHVVQISSHLTFNFSDPKPRVLVST